MKIFKGLFVMGLIVTGLILSQSVRAQEALVGESFSGSGTENYIAGQEALNTKTGKTVCISLTNYLGVVDASPVLEYMDGAACNLAEGGSLTK